MRFIRFLCLLFWSVFLLPSTLYAQVPRAINEVDFNGNFYGKALMLNELYVKINGQPTIEAYRSAIEAAQTRDADLFRERSGVYYHERRIWEEDISSFEDHLYSFSATTDFKNNIFLRESYNTIRKGMEDIHRMNDSIKKWEAFFWPGENFDPLIEDSDADGVSDFFDVEAYDPLSVLSNFNRLQGDMINALSNIIADRFRQEAMNMAMMSLFRSMVRDDSTMVANLFPKTFRYIETMLSEGSFYSADLNHLRQIVHLDVGQLDRAFDASKNRLFKGFDNHPLQKTTFLLASNFLDTEGTLSRHDILMTDVVDPSVTPEEWDAWLGFMRSLSHTVEMPADDTTNGAHWDGSYYDGMPIKWIDVEGLLPPQNVGSGEVNFFYGLLYSKLAVPGKFKKHLAQFETKQGAASELFLLLKVFKDEQYVYNGISRDASHMEDAFKNVQDMVNYYGFLSAHPMVQDSFGISPRSFNMAYETIEVVRAFRYKRYTEAINLMALYYAPYLEHKLKSLHSISFLLEFYQVQNAREMQMLIESYALPLGSSSVKRNSRFDVAVNAYAGITGGQEVAYGTGTNQVKWNVGLTAPVGVSTTFGRGKFTAFASILDLGSIVNQRLNNDTVAYSDLKFEQFLSPGLGLFYNVKQSPVTFGFHYGFIPNLRTIVYESGQATITETHTNVSRFNFSVLIDIPLFNLYHRK